jgi:hypothetical protein
MKPRRDITLGEMQDECKKYWNNGNLGSCGKCQFMEVCCHYEAYTPAQLNLTDPPRFNEQQMALLKAFRKSGYLTFEVGTIFNPLEEIIYNFLGLRNGEKIDLAELLGEDAT